MHLHTDLIIDTETLAWTHRLYTIQVAVPQFGNRGGDGGRETRNDINQGRKHSHSLSAFASAPILLRVGVPTSHQQSTSYQLPTPIIPNEPRGVTYLLHLPQAGSALLQLFFRLLQGSQTVGAVWDTIDLLSVILKIFRYLSR